MDWTEQLKAFRDANPDLPEGPEMHDPEPEDTVKRQPRLDIYIERKGRGGYVSSRSCCRLHRNSSRLSVPEARRVEATF